MTHSAAIPKSTTTPSENTVTNVALSQLTKVVAVSAIIAAGAQLEIRLPYTPVPITGQTLSIVLCGLTFGRAAAMCGTLMYLAEGAAGLPVFSGGGSGLHHLTGPTAGYLLGFLPASAISGIIGDRHGYKSPFLTFVAALLASAPIFIAGVSWLAITSGSFTVAFTTGLLPFIPGDFVKALLLSMTLPALAGAIRKR